MKELGISATVEILTIKSQNQKIHIILLNSFSHNISI